MFKLSVNIQSILNIPIHTCIYIFWSGLNFYDNISLLCAELSVYEPMRAY
jgi:hypothetical protein